MIVIGVIGYGYWGPNLARNFTELQPSVRLAAIADLRQERRDLAARRYPSCTVTADYRDILNDPAVDAVLIATPVWTHFPLAAEALRAKKHVLVEKPIAATAAEAEELTALAEREGKVLLVDHPFIYTGAVAKLKQLIDENKLGDLLYIDSVRINLGLFQPDVNVVFDLAVHDISIIDYLLERSPVSVHAVGASHTDRGNENIAYVTIDYGGNLLAHIHVNWLSPVKIRRMIVGGTRNMVIYDDVEPSEKIKVYDRGVRLTMDGDSQYSILTEYRVGDMHAPKLDQTEALLAEARHFVDCVEKGVRPRTGGRDGVKVVRLLEAATESLKTGHAVRV